ncbi:hypothetical protein JCGZ_13566 [Jatropha curcas]|uniref:Uncharacterized protein n=1 Tax=Jatropha curcas TaxID=180498 RepID=A0A067KMU2_JATCU|nr:hypothetical protein JCGZ_13566 [Jatropha curcas]
MGRDDFPAIPHPLLGYLVKEFNIIFWSLPVTEEIPIVPWLDIDPALMILPVFGFSSYEIPSYDFGADIVPLRPLVDRALGMDRTSPYWAPLVCFCLLSQYLLLSEIADLRLVPIVEQTARRRTPFPFILAKTLTWLGDHARDSDSVPGLMGSLLLL